MPPVRDIIAKIQGDLTNAEFIGALWNLGDNLDPRPSPDWLEGVQSATTLFVQDHTLKKLLGLLDKKPTREDASDLKKSLKEANAQVRRFGGRSIPYHLRFVKKLLKEPFTKLDVLLDTGDYGSFFDLELCGEIVERIGSAKKEDVRVLVCGGLDPSHAHRRWKRSYEELTRNPAFGYFLSSYLNQAQAPNSGFKTWIEQVASGGEERRYFLDWGQRYSAPDNWVGAKELMRWAEEALKRCQHADESDVSGDGHWFQALQWLCDCYFQRELERRSTLRRYPDIKKTPLLLWIKDGEEAVYVLPESAYGPGGTAFGTWELPVDYKGTLLRQPMIAVCSGTFESYWDLKPHPDTV